jgi:hypothetical protein
MNRIPSHLQFAIAKSGVQPDSIERTSGGHIKLTVGTKPIYTAATPSDHRAGLNIAAQLKRITK